MTERQINRIPDQTLYSSDGVWFPYTSIEDYRKEHPEKGYVFSADIRCFKNEFMTNKQKDSFEELEKATGREASYIVGKVKLHSIEKSCPFCQLTNEQKGRLFNANLEGNKLTISTNEGPTFAKSETFAINYCPHCGRSLPLSSKK